MMTPNIHITEEGAQRLKHLQDAWHRTHGRRPTQRELLRSGLAYLERRRDAFLAEAAWRPLTPSEIQQLRRLQVRSGDQGDYDVDDEVYG